MSFVEMAYFGMDTQCLQQPPSADAQYDLLFDPHFVVTAIYFSSDPPIEREIPGIVAVQQ